MGNSKYDAGSIKVLKGLEAIRKRPGMYIGGTGANGVYRLFREILDNAVDEYQAGYNKSIYVWWKQDQVWIGDAGRGMPVEEHPEEKISTLTVLFTMTHAGGKFDASAYKTSSGLHGVGIKATNALSEWLEVYTKRKGQWWCQKFERGKPKDVPKKVDISKLPKFLKGANKMSTIIGFSPDTSLMSTKTVNRKRIAEEIEDLSYLCPGLLFKLFLVDEGKKKQWMTKDGIRQFVDEEYTSTYQKSPFYASTKDGRIEVALKWTNQEESEVFSYVNCSFTDEGGTHLKGLNKAASSVLRRYGSELDASDLRAGMCGIIHVRMNDPVYRGQTKNELTNEDIEKEVYQFVKRELDLYFKKHTSVANHIIKRAKILANARNKANVAKQALKEVKIEKKGKKGIMPGKLVEAPNCSPKERELFIVEGESAGGSVKLARDNKYQEVLPLRGKIPNALRTKPAKFLGNEEISAINTAVGTHVGQKCRVQNCRYNKIMILTDADPDGKHIAALLIAYFGKYMPDVIKAGKLYVVDSPLYRGYNKNKYAFGFSIDEVRKKFPKGATVQITRLKGHGEANPEQVENYALNPKTRKLIQVKWKSDSMEMITQVLGNDTTYRKELLGV